MDSEIKYVTFVEKSQDEKETFIIYIQYNGNEESLTRLKEALDKAECSEFFLDLNHFISKSSVQEHLALSYGSYSKMFSEAIGKLCLPEWMDDLENLDEMSIASNLDEYFYKTHILNYFE